ncbi:hypothetical protein E6H23_11040, partial [Candidatus Bathyarchaeota archaeon]
MKFQDFLFRAWYYFRTGYGIYLAFLIGFLSNMIVIFKLAFEPVELTCSPPSYLGPLASCPNLLGRILKSVFPSLAWFAIIATALTIPFGVY